LIRALWESMPFKRRDPLERRRVPKGPGVGLIVKERPYTKV